MKKLVLLSFLISSSLFAKDLSPCHNQNTSDIQIISIEQPSYPTSPTPSTLEGYVKMELLVNKFGEVEKVIVIDAVPKRRFDRAAIRSIKKSKFSKSTKPELRCGLYTIEFILE